MRASPTPPPKPLPPRRRGRLAREQARRRSTCSSRTARVTGRPASPIPSSSTRPPRPSRACQRTTSVATQPGSPGPLTSRQPPRSSTAPPRPSAKQPPWAHRSRHVAQRGRVGLGLPNAVLLSGSIEGCRSQPADQRQQQHLHDARRRWIPPAHCARQCRDYCCLSPAGQRLGGASTDNVGVTGYEVGAMAS